MCSSAQMAERSILLVRLNYVQNNALKPIDGIKNVKNLITDIIIETDDIVMYLSVCSCFGLTMFWSFGLQSVCPTQTFVRQLWARNAMPNESHSHSAIDL